jgi:hypothetical protein
MENQRKMKKKCIFCDNEQTEKLYLDLRIYHHCKACNSIFLGEESQIDPESEKKRYTLHENSLENTGYREYLESFISAIFSFPDIRILPESKKRLVFDYGSGPEASLAQLFRISGYEVRYRDPYFAPDNQGFEQGADIVTCLEVAEHFRAPRADFNLISACVRPEGFLALGTHILDKFTSVENLKTFFSTWWYRQDITHVSFYSEQALCLVARNAGFDFLGRAGTHIFMFKKHPENL